MPGGEKCETEDVLEEVRVRKNEGKEGGREEAVWEGERRTFKKTGISRVKSKERK